MRHNERQAHGKQMPRLPTHYIVSKPRYHTMQRKSIFLRGFTKDEIVKTPQRGERIQSKQRKKKS